MEKKSLKEQGQVPMGDKYDQNNHIKMTSPTFKIINSSGFKSFSIIEDFICVIGSFKNIKFKT